MYLLHRMLTEDHDLLKTSDYHHRAQVV